MLLKAKHITVLFPYQLELIFPWNKTTKLKTLWLETLVELTSNGLETNLCSGSHQVS